MSRQGADEADISDPGRGPVPDWSKRPTGQSKPLSTSKSRRKRRTVLTDGSSGSSPKLAAELTWFRPTRHTTQLQRITAPTDHSARHKPPNRPQRGPEQAHRCQHGASQGAPGVAADAVDADIRARRAGGAARAHHLPPAPNAIDQLRRLAIGAGCRALGRRQDGAGDAAGAAGGTGAADDAHVADASLGRARRVGGR